MPHARTARVIPLAPAPRAATRRRDDVSLTFGSLFAGIGGMDRGLEWAGWKCRWAVEIDDYARKVYKSHWPHVELYGDVRSFLTGYWHPSSFTVDAVVGGFPCTDISNAGARAGIDGEQSGLWSEFRRVLCLLRPDYAIVENVAALLDRGIGTVLGDLADCGFDAAWEVLTSCAFGAAHTRPRVFIVAYANGVDGRPRLRNPLAQQDWSLQAIDGTPRSRASRQARVANPSALYGGAHGLAFGRERNRCIGNSVDPHIAQWLARAVMEAHPALARP